MEGFEDLVKACYGEFEAPVVNLSPLRGGVVAELFHGPTQCFKDLSMPFLVRVLARFAAERGARKTLVVSTTGDTGPAAVRAVSSVASPYLRVLCFYPEGMISDYQRKQMTTVENATIASFDGGGDDMDAPLKKLGREEKGLCGANSYNIARPLAQMVHFFWIALKVGPCDVVVPTGAMGNLVAATMAKLRGAPIGKIVAATNSNDFSYRALTTGDCARSKQMLKTLSDAINIQTPYNFERLLYYNGAEDAAARGVSGEGRLEPDLVATLRENYDAVRVDDDRMLRALREVASSGTYVPDPHAAVALAAAQDLGMLDMNRASPRRTTVVVATAHACKFRVAVEKAVGRERWASLAATFPPRVAETLAAPEKPPYRLKKNPGESLEDAQARWIDIVRNNLLLPLAEAE
ncbi:hypothetical protein CTAYLR_004545 [Chrysophaeum taylorii]|uniref:Tryptophan synthase beta chain-like PALP domain-containing protein n=1 Tax=Chrysophaeum taylorii TaxID=2483200 RepID=A0AAD7UNM3_9STRA|nr:hypothetical protein CTAYLR_004545 [Chrysophaeum taylorii]